MRCLPLLLLISALHVFPATLVSQVRRPAQAPATTSVEGIVREILSGAPLADVTVVLSSTAGGSEFGAVSGHDGEFKIEGVPPGQYVLHAGRPDVFSEVIGDVRVEFGTPQKIVVEVRLSSSSVSREGIRRPGTTRNRMNEKVEAGEIPDRAVRRVRPSRNAESAEPVQSNAEVPDFVRIENRWRIPLPPWQRYPDTVSGDYPYSSAGSWWDPYHQNILKGDYPVIGNRWFVSLSGTSETAIEARQAKLGDSGHNGGAESRFAENLIMSAEVFRGVTAFRPVDVRFRVTPVLNGNRVSTRQAGMQWQGQAAALQEAFAEARLAEVSPAFDFVSVRAGTQFFKSDFRGFVFSSNEPGLRLFGNLKSNRHQYNVAYFRMLSKDPNSFLNTLRSRHQDVVIANYYIQDFVKPGYTTQFSVHFDRERTPKTINATYLGWTGDGHFGGLGIDHAFYQVLGRENPASIAESHINAQMAAMEISLDQDWRRYRASFFYSSGDGNPQDHRSRGFDGIFDNAQFAGGPISFWNRQEVRIIGAAAGLTPRASLYPALRISKELGQTNFTNPGLYLVNAGFDADVTPRLRASANLNWLSFARTEALEPLLSKRTIPRAIGFDIGSGVRWRPLLSDNVILSAGASTLIPAPGFRQSFSVKSLFSTFLELRLTY